MPAENTVVMVATFTAEAVVVKAADIETAEASEDTTNPEED